MSQVFTVLAIINIIILYPRVAILIFICWSYYFDSLLYFEILVFINIFFLFYENKNGIDRILSKINLAILSLSMCYRWYITDIVWYYCGSMFLAFILLMFLTTAKNIVKIIFSTLVFGLLILSLIFKWYQTENSWYFAIMLISILLLFATEKIVAIFKILFLKFIYKIFKGQKMGNQFLYKPKTKDELRELIEKSDIYLGDIDTSLITDMSDLFISWNDDKPIREDFSGITNWDTSNVENMNSMFYNCSSFNQPLNWDTSKVTYMRNMFYNCSSLNQPLNFVTSKVVDMSNMFKNCKNFNQPLNFDTSNVEDMNNMFYGCENLNQPLNFDTSKVVDMRWMFDKCKNFNQPLNFNTSNVKNMSGMFRGCKSFNQPLVWNTSKVINMHSMFYNCENFNQPLNWNTSKVRDMSNMFYGCSNFNQQLNLDTTNVINTGSLCLEITLTQDD